MDNSPPDPSPPNPSLKPSSSKPRNAPLPRNSSCLKCRSRKIRCDAVKPTCGTCLRSHNHAIKMGTDPSPVISCVYEDGGDEQPMSSASMEGVRAPKAVQKRKTSSMAGGEGEEKSKKQRSGDDYNIPYLEDEMDADALKAQIAMLQSKLASKGSAPSTSASPAQGSYPSPHDNLQSSTYSASSDNLLDLLSSAAVQSANNGGMNYGMPPPAQPYSTMGNNQQSYNPNSAFASSSSASYPGGPSFSSMQTFSYSDTVLAGPAGMGMGGGGMGQGNVPTVETMLEEPMLSQQGIPNDILGDFGGLNYASGDTFLQEIFFPGWDKDLPEPALMDHLIDIFFTNIPLVGRMINREKFMAAMVLPPTSPNFIDSAILHAICATASRYSGLVHTSDPGRETPEMVGPLPGTSQDFGVNHAMLCRFKVHTHLQKGEKLFECATALSVLLAWYHTEARWVEGWMVSGMVVRMLGPMGLMNKTQPPTAHTKPSVLKAPKNDTEREERYALTWAAMMLDVGQSSASGWPGAMQMDEINIPLPAGIENFESATSSFEENPQYAYSSDLFVRHPIVDGFTLEVKSFLLLGKVNKYIRMWKAKGLSPDAFAAGRYSPEFRSIDASIGQLILSFPASMRNPLTPSKSRYLKALDTDLFGAQVTLHQIAINLHEPFADLDNPSDTSTCRILSAARGILRMMLLISSTSLDLNLLVRSELSLFTASRTLVSFLRKAHDNGTSVAGNEATLMSELEVFRSFFNTHATKFPLGMRHAKMLDQLIEAARSDDPNAVPIWSCSGDRVDLPGRGNGNQPKFDRDFTLAVANTPRVESDFLATLLSSSTGNSSGTSGSEGGLATTPSDSPGEGSTYSNNPMAGMPMNLQNPSAEQIGLDYWREKAKDFRI